nr:hypothetical protein [Mucilaginibacter sp. L294]
MSRIIALAGRASSGKTTTIHMLPAILIANGYSHVPGSRKSYGKDFLEIYIKGKITLGITSSGDTYDLVHQRLTDLVAAKCDDIVCACRTSGGTHHAIHSFAGYSSVFLNKTYASSPSLEPTVNATDANNLFITI